MLPENPEYAVMRHGDDILSLQWPHGTTRGQRAAVRFLSFPRTGTGMGDRTISYGFKQRKSTSGVKEKIGLARWLWSQQKMPNYWPSKQDKIYRMEILIVHAIGQRLCS